MKLISMGLVLGLLATVQSHAETLTFFNWEHYLSPEVVEAWEKHSGTKLQQVFYDNGEDRDRTLVSSLSIDVAVINQDAIQTLAKKNAFLKLKKHRKHLGVVDYAQFSLDACGDYTAPYLWGTIGIGYRKDIVEKPPTSWRDLLNPISRHRGAVSILKEPADAFIPSLLMSGKNIDSHDYDVLKNAFYQMMSIVPNLLTFEYPITYLGNNTQDQRLHMGMVYSGDQYTMNDIQGKDVWGYAIPEEGTSLWIDCLAVMSTSKKQDLALEFIKFISQPEMSAINSSDVYVATPNLQAQALQSQDILNDKTIYPPQSVLDKSQAYPFLSTDNLRLRNRMLNALVRKLAQHNGTYLSSAH